LQENVEKIVVAISLQRTQNPLHFGLKI